MQTLRTLPLDQKGAKKFLSDPIRQRVAQHHTATPGERIVRRLPLEALMAESLINILDPVSE